MIAEYLDKIVNDEKFRLELKKKQMEWVKKVFDSNRIGSEWNQVFFDVVKKRKKQFVKPIYNLILKIYFRR